VTLFLCVFLLGAAGVFWFTAHEPTGATLLLVTSIGFGYVSLVLRGAARRAERLAGGRQKAAIEQAEVEVEENIAPTIWPFGFSIAALTLLLGAVLVHWLFVVGAVLFVASAAGWFNDIRRQHAHPAPASLDHDTEAARSTQETAGE
jgi:Cytochrome c oxidase subunit IV